jgi:formylglycine-generating enzyme required for sulfatase activity
MMVLALLFAFLGGAGWWPVGPTRAGDEPKRVALLVGVNRYRARAFADRPLDYAEKNVNDLAEVLRAQGFEVHVLTGAVATRQAIDDALDVLLRGRAADDLVLIAFAGHGVQMPLVDDQRRLILDDRGREQSDAYYCPVDAQYGRADSMISLTRLFERLKFEGGINLVLADACRDDPEAAKLRGLRSLSGNELNGRLPKNSAIFFSCAADQQARETDKAGGGHGIFFHHVIEGLRGAAADRETGEVNWGDLTNYVQRNVNRKAVEWFPEEARLKRNRLQTPHLINNIVDIPVLAHVDVRRPDIPAPPVPAPVDVRSRDLTRPSFAESIGIKIVPIPAGDFFMGSSPEQVEQMLKLFPNVKKEDYDDEQPRHRVQITRIQGLSAHEVTVGQFRKFVEDAGYKTEAERDGKGGYGYDVDKKQWVQDPKFIWRNPGFEQSDDHPVVEVSWNDATEFCRWLSRKDGRNYRLPTEAQWEYCCRAGTETLYSNGDDPERLARVGNVANARAEAQFPGSTTIAADDGFVFTAPVGRYEPNAWGLYDMHGNVWEWCLDFYDVAYYKNSATADPRGPSSAASRVFRGGCWSSAGGLCRSACRIGFAPGDRSSRLGFRVARVPSG